MSYVRFTSESGHSSARVACLLRAEADILEKGPARKRKTALQRPLRNLFDSNLRSFPFPAPAEQANVPTT
jgi:hypothetical protein